MTGNPIADGLSVRLTQPISFQMGDTQNTTPDFVQLVASSVTPYALNMSRLNSGDVTAI